MYIKYYGVNYHNSKEALVVDFALIDPYAIVATLSVSYCVWIVPGTMDCDGNSLLL